MTDPDEQSARDGRDATDLTGTALPLLADDDGIDEPDEAVTASIDLMLRAKGARRRMARGIQTDVDDLRRRGARQSRRQQLSGVAAVALVLGMGAVAATARPFHVGDDTEAGRAAGAASGIDATAVEPEATTGRKRTGDPYDPTGRGTAAESSTTGSTGAPASTKAAPSSSAAPTTTVPARNNGKGQGRSIRAVDFRNGTVALPAECDDGWGAAGDDTGAARRKGQGGRVEVASVTYGDVAGDDTEDAVVTVSCGPGASIRAYVYSLDPAGAAGVARVASVTPGAGARARLFQQGVGLWALQSLLITGNTVESTWSGHRSNGRDPSCTFTLRQRWTGSGWEQLGPVKGNSR